MSLSLRDIPLFRDLSEKDLRDVKRCLREKSFEKGEALFTEGNRCEKVFIVQSGRAKLYRLSSGGREQVLETLGPGDTCACNPGSSVWTCATSAEALMPCRVWYLSRPDYVRMVKTNSKVSTALNQLFADRLRCFSGLIEEVSLKDSKKRLVRFLLDMLSEKSNNATQEVLYVLFTREEIANRIGTARETVARNLHELRRAKLIDIQPKQIIIRDREGLEKLL